MGTLYSPDNGRPSIDPVVLFKIVFIQYLLGIRSMRQTIKEIEVNTPPATKDVRISTTDPECGLFHKKHEKQFAYTTHVACDKHNFIVGSDVSAGNVHDSVMFDGLYRSVLGRFPEVKAVAVDSGYKTPWIMKQIFDSERIAATPYKAHDAGGFFQEV